MQINSINFNNGRFIQFHGDCKSPRITREFISRFEQNQSFVDELTALGLINKSTLVDFQIDVKNRKAYFQKADAEETKYMKNTLISDIFKEIKTPTFASYECTEDIGPCDSDGSTVLTLSIINPKLDSSLLDLARLCTVEEELRILKTIRGYTSLMDNFTTKAKYYRQNISDQHKYHQIYDYNLKEKLDRKISMLSQQIEQNN